MNRFNVSIRDIAKEVPEATKKVFGAIGKFGKEVAQGIPQAYIETALKITGENKYQPTGKIEQAILGRETIKKPSGVVPTGLAILGTLPILPGKKQVAKTAIEEIPKIAPVVQKIIDVLKISAPIRKTQETLYTVAREERIAESLKVGTKTTGEKGFYSELGVLKGELPKVQFESIRNKVSQTDIDEVFNIVKENPLLNEWDKITARTGLAKLFGEFGGKVPTENEISLLTKVFPKEFIQTIIDKKPFVQKAGEVALQLANIPRSVMASFDLSAPLRQGLFLIGRPKQFLPAFVDMFKAFGSEKAFKSIQESIVRKPTFKLMQEVKLPLTEMDNILNVREERFMSQWAEKIPVAGKVIRASGRAYTGFLNKLRADVFDDLIVKAENLGLNPKKNIDLAKEIGNYIGNATGRGGLGSLEKGATALNAFFFSPRLMASRINLLNPLYYIKANPFVRKQALKDLFTLTGITGTILGLAKLGGADVETNPNSSDFAKIKIGNTRVDTLGGFQQYIRMTSQLLTGKYVSSMTGKKLTLGEGYKPLTRYDILMRQVEAKEAPVMSFITDLLRGQDYAGKPISVPNEIIQRFIPMVGGDIKDIIKENPLLLPVGVLGIFGAGLQTYQPTKSSGNRFNY
jgi:hypothetical protein